MFAARAMRFTAAAAPPPTISVIYDWELTAGETLTIHGSNFLAGATSVKFNSANGTSVNVTSPTTLTVTVPNLGSAQQVSVTVTTPGGTSNAYSNPVFYGVPTYSSVSPSSGKTGDSITVNGSNFTGSGSPSATVGGVPATITGYGGNGQFTVTVPAISTSGSKTITYTNPGGTMTATNVFAFTAAPTISGVSPNPASAGQTITITGSNFVAGSTTVSINGVAATSVSVASTTSLTCVVPNASTYSALVSLSVTTAGGTASTTLNYTAPSISAVSPPQGPAGTVLTVTGAGFTGSVSATVGGVAAAVTVHSSTSLSVTVPTISGEGAKNVVITPAGGAVTAAGAFTYYNTYSAASTSYTAAGSGAYSIPLWCNKIDVIVMGGGGSGGGSLFGAWGGGGNAGSYASTTLVRGVDLAWGATTIAYAVGAGGAQVAADTAGNSGQASTCSGLTGAGGSGGPKTNNGPNGTTTNAITVNGAVYPAAVGGTYGSAATANSNPGSGGGGGGAAAGPYQGRAGRDGAVYFRAHQ